MSWDQLHNAIYALGPSGHDGFEGLVARLLQRLTGMPFHVAASGSQPSGDARDRAGSVSMQAKRYAESTTLRPADIEADFLRAANTCPQLEVYVLATTQAVSAQVLDSIARLETEKAIEGVVLSFAGEPSELGALCVSYWESVAGFFAFADDEQMTAWIAEQSRAEAVHEIVERLRASISGCLHTSSAIRRAATAYLADRFTAQGSKQLRVPSEIDLAIAISREELTSQFKQWIDQDTENPCFCFVGEEGTGKT